MLIAHPIYAVELKAIASNIYSNTINIASCIESIYMIFCNPLASHNKCTDASTIVKCIERRWEDMGNGKIRNT